MRLKQRASHWQRHPRGPRRRWELKKCTTTVPPPAAMARNAPASIYQVQAARPAHHPLSRIRHLLEIYAGLERVTLISFAIAWSTLSSCPQNHTLAVSSVAFRAFGHFSHALSPAAQNFPPPFRCAVLGIAWALRLGHETERATLPRRLGRLRVPHGRDSRCRRLPAWSSA